MVFVDFLPVGVLRLALGLVDSIFLRGRKKRIAREQALYRNTHSFLPERHGLRPNTLHVIFDVVTVAILITLAVLTAQAR